MSRRMTHAGAFSDHQFDHMHERDEARIRSCHQPLVYLGSCFHSDVPWGVYACAVCGVKVWAVADGVHWWNYEEALAATGAA